jgi:hypothetical protein
LLVSHAILIAYTNNRNPWKSINVHATHNAGRVIYLSCYDQRAEQIEHLRCRALSIRISHV